MYIALRTFFHIQCNISQTPSSWTLCPTRLRDQIDNTPHEIKETLTSTSKIDSNTIRNNPLLII